MSDFIKKKQAFSGSKRIVGSLGPEDQYLSIETHIQTLHITGWTRVSV